MERMKFWKEGVLVREVESRDDRKSGLESWEL